MDVFEAVDSRISCRWFLDRPVNPALVRNLIADAARAASGGNLQPWQVYALTGAPLAELKAKVAAAIADRDPRQVDAEYPIYPKTMWEPYRSRREHHGVQLYGALAIDRDDTAARLAQYKRNCEFFNAPVALFIAVDRRLGPGQWADRRLYSCADVFGARSRARHLRPGILGAHASYRRTVRENAAGADAVLRGGDRLWRPRSSGQQLPRAAGRAGGFLPVLWFRLRACPATCHRRKPPIPRFDFDQIHRTAILFHFGTAAPVSGFPIVPAQDSYPGRRHRECAVPDRFSFTGG